MPTPAYPPGTVVEDADLSPLNTFGLSVRARRYLRVASVDELRGGLAVERPKLVLGGGSNMLLINDVDGLVLHVDIRGREVLGRDADAVVVEAGAGEGWHDFVRYTIGEGFGGLENLSLIPGSVGATPIQNIGAYGVEVKDHIVHVRATDVDTRQERIFGPEECGFGYRDSAFKRELRGRYVITHVAFRLTAREHAYRLDYGDVRARVDATGQGATLQSVSDAVTAIRREKLPDPAEIGNSGSFFKNPELTADAFARLRERRPDVRFYELPDGGYKVPAGWLIDQAGWKGHRRGPIGVHDRQALVLVNHGGGSGSDLWRLACDILDDVEEKFGIRLEPEVNVI